MSLLSNNDYKALLDALRHMEPMTLTQTLEGQELTVSVLPASVAWPVAMVVQVRAKEGRVEWVQTFESVEEARQNVEQSKISVVGIH